MRQTSAGQQAASVQTGRPQAARDNGWNKQKAIQWGMNGNGPVYVVLGWWGGRKRCARGGVHVAAVRRQRMTRRSYCGSVGSI